MFYSLHILRCGHLKCKAVIYVSSTAGSKKQRMQHMLSNLGSQNPALELCADEVVANPSRLKRVKVRFTPTGSNQYPARTIDFMAAQQSRISEALEWAGSLLDSLHKVTQGSGSLWQSCFPSASLGISSQEARCPCPWQRAGTR